MGIRVLVGFTLGTRSCQEPTHGTPPTSKRSPPFRHIRRLGEHVGHVGHGGKGKVGLDAILSYYEAMDEQLKAVALRREMTARGLEADVLVVEPNGEEYPVGCICRVGNIEIGGDDAVMTYLTDRY